MFGLNTNSERKKLRGHMSACMLRADGRRQQRVLQEVQQLKTVTAKRLISWCYDCLVLKHMLEHNTPVCNLTQKGLLIVTPAFLLSTCKL